MHIFSRQFAYNVNDAALSIAQSIRFDCLKILWTEVDINLEVTGFVYEIWHMKCLF